MVVIVIRTQSKDSDEEFYSSGEPENPRGRVFASSRLPETTHDERESWPSPYDSSSNNSKLVNGNQTICEGTPRNLNSTSKLFREYRMDSPLSKDSGFSDKMTSFTSKKPYRTLETRKTLMPKMSRMPFPSLLTEIHCHDTNNNHNNDYDDVIDNRTASLCSFSQADPDDTLAKTKEGKQLSFSFFFSFLTFSK